MRSIFAKVLLWSLGTVALALLALWGISRAVDRRGPPEGDPFWKMIAMIEDDACRAYEDGGPDKLAAHLRRLDAELPGAHYLTDARGRDLVGGEDRSALLAAKSAMGPPRLPDGRLVLMGRPRGGRYRFLTLVRPWFGPPNMLPYVAAVVLVIALMGAALAAHLVAPLRRLRDVVDRFGGGNLDARAASTRKDEIGELSRAFDLMAGRIATLLNAERRLLQDVSHELRSPLARLRFAVELARASDDRAASFDRIQRDVVRLNDLVDELLQLTRAEGDPSSLGAEHVRLDDLLRSVADDCAIEAEAKGCRVTVDAEPAALRGEGELLRRAVENVLRNAVRHAPEGTPILAELRAEDGTATLTIRDRGEGVPEAALDEIFRPFFRVEGDRSRTSGGVGLGLSIARRAVLLHGGEIHARNAAPGLIVSIELPEACGVLTPG